MSPKLERKLTRRATNTSVILRKLGSSSHNVIRESEGMSKQLETKLPDAAIIRLLEVSMEEMVLFEVNNPSKVISQNFKDYLKSFLYT